MTDAMTQLVAGVIVELEAAGATLLALPMSGYSTTLRTGGLDFVRDAIESYGWTDMPIRPAVPSSRAISRMDAALAWISLIPENRLVLRRIVGARALVHPITERHLFSWRRLGNLLKTDHHAVQRQHLEGIELIVARLATQK
jgi:hypothetical protein